MPRALELFSGTNSVGELLRQNGWEVTSLDNRPKYNPTIATDITTWDYSQYPKGHFEYIHASPPCCEYSRALSTRPRRFENADPLALRALEIIAALQPKWWTIENPDGELKNRWFMEPLQQYLHKISYCKYSDDTTQFKYKKPTCIWTNLRWTPRPMCCKASPCEWVEGKTMHPVNAQKMQNPGRDQINFKTDDLGKLPPALVQEWVDAMRVHDPSEPLPN